MDYINDININEAVIHILDNNGQEPVLNEYKLDLDEDTYKYIFKHIEKCFKDEELKYAVFKGENNAVKELVNNFFNSENKDIIGLSKEIANRLFDAMKSNAIIPSCDLVVASIITDQGPMISILKMDYVKNFTHEINFIEDKIGIDIVPQAAGLPGSGQRIQKAAFIKPINEEDSYDLMVLDKRQKANDEAEENAADFFIKLFLRCSIFENDRDMTKSFLKATEKWTRKNFKNNASQAEKIRTAVKSKLKDEEVVNVEQLSEELFNQTPELKSEFNTYVKEQGIDNEVKIDKTWVDKKLKRVRLKIDKEIDLYVNEETYHDNNRFEIQRNGDGSINMIIKHVINYIEK